METAGCSKNVGALVGKHMKSLSQKTTVLIPVAMRTSDLTQNITLWNISIAWFLGLQRRGGY
jgi:hypothetical protein